MQAFDLYGDIAARTNGQIYLGVVGPVRTGKSTFIKRFMEVAVLPAVTDESLRERMIDELPQSGAGRTIMTTQPHFVPEQGMEVDLGEATARVRLVDCVGYMTQGALGYQEDGQPRRVTTPWSDEEMAFESAAELGTRKVIQDHATIGIVMTTDGTITDLPRAGYVSAEERVIDELRQMGKPFVVVLNSAQPTAPETATLASDLAEKYGVAVTVVDALNMAMDDVQTLLSEVLLSFPLREITLDIPTWARALPADHWLIDEILQAAAACTHPIATMRDAALLLPFFDDCQNVAAATMGELSLATGTATVTLTLGEGLYYALLSEACGVTVQGDFHLLQLLREFAGAKRDYDRYHGAIQTALESGYGMVAPTVDDMTLAEPAIVKQGGKFGVKLKASAPSLHVLRVGVESEVSPIVGTEKQSEEMMRYLMEEFEQDPQAIWNTHFFGKSLHDMVKEGLSGKLMHMPQDVQNKMTSALTRIINEGSGGLICILL